MDPDLRRIDAYLAPGAHYHFARRRLLPGAPRAPHRHDFYELMLVERGAVRDGGAAEVLPAGSLVFLRPGDVHDPRAAGEEPARIVEVAFRREIADHLVGRYGEEFEGQFFWSPEPRPVRIRLSGPRIERAVNVALELESSHRTLARIEEFLLAVMTRVVELPEAGPRTLPDWLARACAEARRPEVFRGGAAALVGVAGRAHGHVCRQMRAHLGTTPSAFVNRRRTEHAARLLAASDLTIAEIAASCGLENVSHFYRTFRRHYGLTPHAYRATHRAPAP